MVQTQFSRTTTAVAMAFILVMGLSLPAAAASHLNDSSNKDVQVEDEQATANTADNADHEEILNRLDELETQLDRIERMLERTGASSKKGKQVAKKQKQVKKQPAPQGELRVCKLLIDEDDNVVRGENISATFSTDVSGEDVDETVSFSTPLDLNGDLNDNDRVDSECTTHRNLSLGTYDYTEEDISGDDTDRVNHVGVNDDFEVGQDDLSSFNEYDTAANADGEVELTESDRDATVVLLNEVVEEEEEQPAENVTKQAPKKMKKKYAKKQKRQPVRGELEVCKALQDENGEPVEGDNVSADFSVDWTGPQDFERTASFSTPLTHNADLDDDGENDARCSSVSDLRLGDYEYSEEDVSGDDADRVSVVGYNDDHQDGDSLSDVSDYTDSAQSDGEVTLTRSDRDQRLLIVNELAAEEEEQAQERRKTVKKKKYPKKQVKQPQQPVEGELRVCKLFVDENDTVVRGEDVDATFSTDVSGEDVDETVSFSTPLDLNGDLNDNDRVDSECTTHSDLSLGTYEYSAEDVSGADSDRITMGGYNDDFEVGQDDLSSFNDYTDSSTSDGEITLTESDRNRTLVLLNVLEAEEEEQPTQPNVTKSKKKMSKKGMYMKGKKQMTMPSQDTEAEQAEEELPEEEEAAEEEDVVADMFDDDFPFGEAELAEEEELAQEEQQEAEMDDTSAVDTAGDSIAAVEQTAFSNIMQDADVSADNGTAFADQDAASNIEQSADVSAS